MEVALERIKKDIKENNFSQFYLLYGSENFLKLQQRDRLIKAMLPDGDEINLSRFEGSGIEEREVISIAETLPFFSERRLIVIKDSGWFKKNSEVSEYLEKCPDTTCFVFIENEVDKRNKLYKYVSANGYATEIKTPDTKNLMTSVSIALKNKGLSITASDCEYFVGRVGSDMSRVQTELDKLTAYCYGKSSVSREDIESICSEIPESKVFQMIDAMMIGKTDVALQFYYQLLAAHEKPMSVLFLLIRNYDQFYKVLTLNKKGVSKQRIGSITGARDFVIDKYIRLGRSYDTKKLKAVVDFGIDLEEKIKQGNMDERMAVEIFIVKFSTL